MMDKRDTPEQQTAATDNALVEELDEAFQRARYGGDGTYNPDGDLFDMAAERIKSLLAAVKYKHEAMNHAIDVIKLLEADLATAEADRQRMRDALVWADLKIRSFPGADQSDVEFIRAALNPASKEANDA